MKIAITIPTNDWMMNLIPELKKLRHEVIVNDCESDCDVLLTMSHSIWQLNKQLHNRFPDIPLIMLNWDWYDYIDKTILSYVETIKLMKEAKEVWSGSKNTAMMCEKDIGIKSNHYLYVCILPWEWEGKKRDWGYILQASRADPNKRFDWYEKAATELGIPFKSYYPHTNSRPDYIRTLKNCSFLVSASREEGVGITPIEAAYCKKPFLTGDHGAAKEIWGDDATYFKVEDYEDFKRQMKWVGDNRTKVSERVNRAYKRVEENYLPQHFAFRIHNRLKEIIK